MTPTLHAQILTLKKYQAWRTGKDTRTMGEVGIKPAAITSALNAVIAIAEDHLRDATKMIEPVKVPSDDELLEWAGQEQFFLFCSEDEFLDIARSLLSKYATTQPQQIPEPHPWRESMSSNHRSYAEGWDACRKAMLKAAPEQKEKS